MPTVIRLKRGGRTHAPYYKVVVTDSRKKTTGRVIEEIGIYHPCARPEPRVEVKADRALEWLSKGAMPSDTVRSILSKMGVMKAHVAGEAAAPAAEPESAAPEAAAPEAAAPEAPVEETAEETPADA
jgi:small subunit ribosomal protein S16